MKCGFSILLYLLFVYTTASGQNLSGHWVGGLPQDDKSFVFRMETDIIQDGNQLSGQSRFISNTDEWVVEHFEGKIVGDKVYFDEKEVISDSAPKGWAWCVKKFSGKIKFSGDIITIRGKWASNISYSNGVYFAGICAPGQFIISKSRIIKIPANRTINSVTTTPFVNIEVANVNKVIALKNVVFELSKDILLPSSQLELGRLVKLLEVRKLLNIRIHGHTDKIGDSAKNLTLSQQRAQAVKHYLIQHGIDESRIKTNGYGDTHTICPAPCEANRRVEFTLYN